MVAVVGEKEKNNNELSVRLRKGGDLGSLSSALLLNSLMSAINSNVELSEIDDINVSD